MSLAARIVDLMDAARPLAFGLDPERAHRLSIRLLANAPLPRCGADDPRLAVRLGDIALPNPIGMAAGFDKGGEAVDALLALGFGHVEVGTVTPRPQPGNPRPRVFRLPADRAVINRYGFNSEGHALVHARLVRRSHRGGVIGVNIGANRDSSDRIADYVAGIAAFADVASYYTVNISSPNTPGLRDLQERTALSGLLAHVSEARDAASERVRRRIPLLVKIAPDLDEPGLDDVVELALAAGIDGLVVSNTTVSRPRLAEARLAGEAGGLSGRPLHTLSTRVLAQARLRTDGRLPLIGVGGIDSPDAAWEKIRAGADLIQLYTGLVYEGFGLIDRIKRHFLDELDRRGLSHLREAVGGEAERYAQAG